MQLILFLEDGSDEYLSDFWGVEWLEVSSLHSRIIEIFHTFKMI